jgi:predicted metal-dependent hydrolase
MTALVEGYFAAEGGERDAFLEGLSTDELLDLGIELYRLGYYWNAHEAWEQAWLDAPSELRRFYQGLIQLTAAFVHVGRGEYPGSVSLLAAAIDKLEDYAPEQRGVDVASLIPAAQTALARLRALGERRVNEFDPALTPRIERLSHDQG